MALDNWPANPDAVSVVELSKEPTGKGLPCQVRCVLEYTREGDPLGRRSLILNPGLIRQWVDQGLIEVPEDYEGDFVTNKFQAVWDAIPDVPEAVKASVRAQLPTAFLKTTWRQA